MPDFQIRTVPAIGIDMTDEMLALAEKNRREAGIENVQFLRGDIENLPLPDASVDVVISNCVLNLSYDKAAAMREIARVLRAGGRIAVSDVVAEDHLSPEERRERGSYAGCIAGAMTFEEYVGGLEHAGLEEVTVTTSHQVTDGIHASVVRARKPST